MPFLLETRAADHITAAELYPLLRLRTDVFVVEQNCPYPELDGRDLHEGTVHVWAHDEGAPYGEDGISHVPMRRDPTIGSGQ